MVFAGCFILLHFASMLLPSSPRGWLGFLGSLFGAIVLQTRPKKSSENFWKINSFDVCFILLNFASMLLPRTLLKAGWALGALFLEQLSCKLTKKTSNTYWKSMILLCASCCSILLPCFFQELSSELAGLFGFPFWSNCLAIQLLCSGCACFGFRADRLVHKARHSFNKRKP